MVEEGVSFREYLESTGCEQALWDILIAIDAMKIKPKDPIEYIRQNIDLNLTEQFENLRKQINEANEELLRLAKEHPKVYEKFLKWKSKTAKKKKGGGKDLKSDLNKDKKSPDGKSIERKTNRKIEEVKQKASIEEIASVPPSNVTSMKMKSTEENTDADPLGESGRQTIEMDIENEPEEQQQTQDSMQSNQKSTEKDSTHETSEVAQGEQSSAEKVSTKKEEESVSDAMQDAIIPNSSESNEKKANSLPDESIESDSEEETKRKFLCC